MDMSVHEVVARYCTWRYKLGITFWYLENTMSDKHPVLEVPHMTT